MKLKGILTGISLSLALASSAQDVENVVPQPVGEGAEMESAPLQETQRPGSPLHSYYEPIGVDVRPSLPADSLHLPLTTGYGYAGGLWHYPLSWDEWCGWGLHKGLNVSIGRRFRPVALDSLCGAAHRPVVTGCGRLYE